MKRVIRLTESDLNRIVKKVLQEQSQPDPKKIVTDCFMQNLSLKDVTKVPMSCMGIGIKIVTSKKLPDPFQDGPALLSCANDLGKVVTEDPNYVFQKLTAIGNCIFKSASSPVSY